MRRTPVYFSKNSQGRWSGVLRFGGIGGDVGYAVDAYYTPPNDQLRFVVGTSWFHVSYQVAAGDDVLRPDAFAHTRNDREYGVLLSFIFQRYVSHNRAGLRWLLNVAPRYAEGVIADLVNVDPRLLDDALLAVRAHIETIGDAWDPDAERRAICGMLEVEP